MWDHCATPKSKAFGMQCQFSPIDNRFLEISSPKFALKYQLMLTSHLHKEWEAIVFSRIT